MRPKIRNNGTRYAIHENIVNGENRKTFNEFAKMCAKKNNLIPKPFNKVKVISFKVTLHKLWGLVLQKYQNKYVNI